MGEDLREPRADLITFQDHEASLQIEGRVPRHIAKGVEGGGPEARRDCRGAGLGEQPAPDTTRLLLLTHRQFPYMQLGAKPLGRQKADEPVLGIHRHPMSRRSDEAQMFRLRHHAILGDPGKAGLGEKGAGGGALDIRQERRIGCPCETNGDWHDDALLLPGSFSEVEYLVSGPARIPVYSGGKSSLTCRKVVSGDCMKDGTFGALESFVDRVYEAAVLPEFWPAVLRDFARLAESRHAVLIALSDHKYKWVGSSPLMEAMTQEVYQYPGGQDRTRRLLAVPPGGFVTDLDVYSESEILNEPLYTDYLIPKGLGRGVATVINVPTGDTIVVHAEGDFTLGPVRATLKQQLNGLRPHLARSSLVSARLAFERARTAVETLSGLGLAACAVTQAGGVLVANLEFEAEGLLWTTRGGNRIGLVDRRADQQLYDALTMIRTERGVRSLPLTAPDCGPPAVLHVVPIRRAAHDLFGHAAAILVLTKASAAPTQATSLLQALFDLSPTEAVIAARIAAGQTPEQIARADGKSVETVRNQLKRVLGKTGCRRQVDLGRLLAQLIPARG